MYIYANTIVVAAEHETIFYWNNAAVAFPPKKHEQLQHQMFL